MGAFQSNPPRSVPGNLVLYIERPGVCSAGTRSFSSQQPLPAELRAGISPKAWADFALELKRICKQFWVEPCVVVPIIACMCVVLPPLAILFSILILQVNDHDVISSDGSASKPFCSWKDSCIWTVGTELACTWKLCREAGYNHGMFLSTSNNMCLSTFTGNVSVPSYIVHWDVEENYGPFVHDKTMTQGFAAVTADCVRNAPAPAWVGTCILGFVPSILLCVLGPCHMVSRHNRKVDVQIARLVATVNETVRAGGCSLEYKAMNTGLCNARGIRTWRAVIARGNPYPLPHGPGAVRTPAINQPYLQQMMPAPMPFTPSPPAWQPLAGE